jgi:hypothetical protein
MNKMNKIVSLTLGILLLFVGIANAKNCLFAYKNINTSNGPALQLTIGEITDGQCINLNIEPTLVQGSYDCIKLITYNKNDTLVVVPGISKNGKCSSDLTVILIDKNIGK